MPQVPKEDVVVSDMPTCVITDGIDHCITSPLKTDGGCSTEQSITNIECPTLVASTDSLIQSQSSHEDFHSSVGEKVKDINDLIKASTSLRSSPNSTPEQLNDTANFDIAFDINFSPLSNPSVSDTECYEPEDSQLLNSTSQSLTKVIPCNGDEQVPSEICTSKNMTSDSSHHTANVDQAIHVVSSTAIGHSKPSVISCLTNGKQFGDSSLTSSNQYQLQTQDTRLSLKVPEKQGSKTVSSTAVEDIPVEICNPVNNVILDAATDPTDCDISKTEQTMQSAATPDNTTCINLEQDKNKSGKLFSECDSILKNQCSPINDSQENHSNLSDLSDMSEVLSGQMKKNVSTNIQLAESWKPDAGLLNCSIRLDDLNFSSDSEMQESQLSISQCKFIGKTCSLLSENVRPGVTSKSPSKWEKSIDDVCDMDRTSAHPEVANTYVNVMMDNGDHLPAHICEA
jgi:hypothetical protein